MQLNGPGESQDADDPYSAGRGPATSDPFDAPRTDISTRGSAAADLKFVSKTECRSGLAPPCAVDGSG